MEVTKGKHVTMQVAAADLISLKVTYATPQQMDQEIQTIDLSKIYIKPHLLRLYILYFDMYIYNYFYTFLISIFVAPYQIGSTQNLVKNSSFEEHVPLECLNCDYDKDNFHTILKSWYHFSTAPVICDCKYKKNIDEQKKAKLTCNEKVKPFKGCSMLELSFFDGCSNWKQEKTGCASQLATKFDKPLEIGEIYEISFWIYIPDPYFKPFEGHIGMMLYPDLVSNTNNNILNGTQFTLDTVIYNKWYQAKWYVRPTCRLQCLCISFFQKSYESFFKNCSIKGNVIPHDYFIDEVEVKKIANDFSPKNIATPFCKFEENENFKFQIEGATCYFEVGDSIILEKDKKQLDEFAARAKANPKTTFKILGHTDSTGNNHLLLSKARNESVLKCLEEKHRISKFRFEPTEEGAKLPSASNNTEKGKKLNRRVEIVESNSPIENVIYRNVLLLLYDKKKEEAIKALTQWQHFAKQKQYILALYDSRLAPLYNFPFWQNFKQIATKSYTIFPNKKLSFSLDSLWAEDQRPRELHKWIENLSTYFAYIDSSKHTFEVHLEGEFWTDKKISNSDSINFSKMINIIGKNRFPKVSEVGKRQQKAIVLVILHHYNVTEMENYLSIIEETCKNGEAEWIFYATLYDKIQVKKGLPQRYCTQFKDNNFKTPYSIEDNKRVNEYRIKIGLMPVDLD